MRSNLPAWAILWAFLIGCGRSERDRAPEAEEASTPSAAGAGSDPEESCDCARFSCQSLAELELTFCNAGPEDSVGYVTWAGCPFSGRRVTAHHYGALYVFAEDGQLVGYSGGSAFSGSYYACGNVLPCPGAEEQECVHCAGDVAAQGRPLCD